MVFGILAIGLATWVVYGAIGQTAVEREFGKRWFIDKTTGKAYQVKMEVGTSIPAPAPSGGKTGVPAELCYWTKDGQTKEEPTILLTNTDLGKREPTFCPDCGRLVVPLNPAPLPGSKPPPTQQEYAARRTRK